MTLASLTDDEKLEIKKVVDAGEVILEEVETLKEGLKDTVSNLAKELSVKPAVINKAIKLAYKNRTDNAIEDAQQEMTDVEVVLQAAGRM